MPNNHNNTPVAFNLVFNTHVVPSPNMIADDELGGPRPIRVNGGSIRGAIGYDRKRVNGKYVYKRYRVQVVPKSGKDVTISIAPPASCETKSFCTPSGAKLTNTLTKTIRALSGGSTSSRPVPGPVRSLFARKPHVGSDAVAFRWKHPGNTGVRFYKIWHAYDCAQNRNVRHKKVYSPNAGESFIHFSWVDAGKSRRFSVAAMGNHGLGACKNVRAVNP